MTRGNILLRAALPRATWCEPSRQTLRPASEGAKA